MVSGETTPEKRVVPIKEGLFHMPVSSDDEPYLIGSKCSNCGYVSFPKRVVCPACIRDDTMQETRLSREAVLESFTVVWQAPPGFVAPYVQANVKLADGPRMFALLAGVDPTNHDLKLGQKLEMILDRIREDEQGNTVIAWKFRPVAENR